MTQPQLPMAATTAPPGYPRDPATRTRALRVVGLDLSLSATGIATAAGDTLTVKTRADHRDTRLRQIRDQVAVHCAGAQLVVIEDLPKHAMAAGITGMVHGAARVALMDLGVPYVLVVAATLKKYSTGKGNAGKTAMAIAGLKRFGLEFADDNQCDAWWLRIMGLDALGEPLVELPAVQRASLAKVAWPAGLRGAA